MNDIFISYSREDAATAKKITALLEAQGYSVFWDRNIPAGKTWRDVIGAALESARCVVVVWSPNSIGSQWVMEEADRAMERKILLPVTINNVRPPLGFGSIQAADLSAWVADNDESGVDSFIADIASIMGAAAETATTPNKTEQPPTKTRPATADKPAPARNATEHVTPIGDEGASETRTASGWRSIILLLLVLGGIGSGAWYLRDKSQPDAEAPIITQSKTGDAQSAEGARRAKEAAAEERRVAEAEKAKLARVAAEKQRNAAEAEQARLAKLAVDPLASLAARGGYTHLTTALVETDNLCFESNDPAGRNDVTAGSYMAPCGNYSGQLWKIEAVVNGYYRLKSMLTENNNLCLEGNKPGAGSSMGGAPFMAPCGNFTGQYWRIDKLPGDYYKLQTAGSEKDNDCLEGGQPGNRYFAQGRGYMSACGNYSGQSWKLKKLAQAGTASNPATPGAAPECTGAAAPAQLTTAMARNGIEYESHCYYLANGGESCTAACRRLKSGASCDTHGLALASQSVDQCKAIVAKLGGAGGLDYSRSGQYPDDDSGCTYGDWGAADSRWIQVMNKSGTPDCDTVNPETKRMRVCACN